MSRFIRSLSLFVLAVVLVLFVLVPLDSSSPADAQLVPRPNPSVASPSAASPAPPFRPPTDRAVSRRFDLRNGPYGAGNRGLDYAVTAGDPIRSIGVGVVVFAGSVAGERFVTVLHSSGLRSSYSYLSDVRVTNGASVSSGQVLGVSSARFQLGIRRGDNYIDPAPLLGRTGSPMRARLVPVRRV